MADLNEIQNALIDAMNEDPEDRFDVLEALSEELLRDNPDFVILYRPSTIAGAYEYHVVTLEDFAANQYPARTVYQGF